jgi:hypothetical protein
MTCTIAGNTVTVTATGGTGGGGGYATIQNAAAAIAQEATINFLGGFSCVDNPGNLSSDCKISTNAAVSHQFVTGVDSSGNFLRAAILAADVPTLNQSTTGNAATATALSANPTDCSSGQYANAIDAGANLTCAQVAYSQVSGTPTLPVNTTATTHQFFTAYNSATGAFTKAQPSFSDISGTATGAQLPAPATASLGGVDAKDCTGTGHILSINTDGSVTCSADAAGGGGGGVTPTGTGFTHITSGVQDSAAKTVDVSSSDITGVLAASSEPAHTGDVTNSAGSLALSIGAGTVTRADQAADAVGWQFVGTSTLASNSSTISVTLSTARKHLLIRFLIVGYAAAGVARVQYGNVSTIDTGTNYSFGGFNIVSGTSTAPTVSGIGGVSQNGAPVSGSTTTAGRFVQVQISSPGARIKYFTIETSGIATSAAATPNLAYLGGVWSNTTNGIGAVQFTACTTTSSTCTTTSFLSGSSMTVWGRDDN